MPTSRRFTITAAIACAGLLGACGSSSNNSSTTGGPGGTSSPPPSKPVATAAANQINLKTGDVPGATQSPNPNTSGKLDAQLATCAGTVPPGTSIVDLNSPDFNVGSGLAAQSYSSNIKVMPSQTQVSQDLAAIKSAKAKSCIKRQLPNAIAQAGNGQVKFSHVKIATLSVTDPPGTDGSFGYRLTITANAAGRAIAIVVDEFGVAVGRTEVGLSDFGIGKPVPASTEQKLFSLLASRAVSHKV